MLKFIAGTLSVIGVGVMLIAYGLLNPRAAAFEPGAGAYGFARPMLTSDQFMMRDPSALRTGYVDRQGAPVYAVQPADGYMPEYMPSARPQLVSEGLPVRTISTAPAPRREATRTIERKAGRQWKKTALVIGGSSAAGAGLGAIFGGKKGALIGGGASTIFETVRK